MGLRERLKAKQAKTPSASTQEESKSQVAAPAPKHVNTEDDDLALLETMKANAGSMDAFNIEADEDTINKLKDEGVYVEGTPSLFYAEEQVRKDFNQSDIEAMALTLKQDGQMQLITVNPVDESGRYKIEKGECRWRAAQLIPGFKLKAYIDHEAPNRTRADRIIGQFIENELRNKLNFIEQAESIQELYDEGLKGPEIAKRLAWVNDKGVPDRNKVSKIHGFLKLPEDSKDSIRTGKLKDINLLDALRKVSQKDMTKYSLLMEMAQNNELTRPIAENVLKECQTPKENVPEAVEHNSGSDLQSHLNERVRKMPDEALLADNAPESDNSNTYADVDNEKHSPSHHEQSLSSATNNSTKTKAVSNNSASTESPAGDLKVLVGDEIMTFVLNKVHQDGDKAYVINSDGNILEVEISDIEAIVSYTRS